MSLFIVPLATIFCNKINFPSKEITWRGVLLPLPLHQEWLASSDSSPFWVQALNHDPHCKSLDMFDDRGQLLSSYRVMTPLTSHNRVGICSNRRFSCESTTIVLCMSADTESTAPQWIVQNRIRVLQTSYWSPWTTKSKTGTSLPSLMRMLKSHFLIAWLIMKKQSGQQYILLPASLC